MGTADKYLDRKKSPDRLRWSEETHKRRYENDRVLEKSAFFHIDNRRKIC